MRIPTLSLFLLLLACSCSVDKHNFKVEVIVDASQGEMMYLARRTISGSYVIDSAVPEKSGKYQLRGYAEQPDFYVVYSNPGRYINLIVHPGDDFRVLTEASTFDRNYLIEGSADSRLIQKMVNMQTRTLEGITLISDQYENSRNRADFVRIKAEIDSAYERIFTEHKNFSIDLIRENPNSLATLMTLYQQLGRNAPVFDYKKDFMYYEIVDSSLSPLYPNSEAVADLNRKVTELRELLKLEPGAAAPELALPDSTGKIIKLSSLKGRYTVIIFWASWSSQSVAEINRFAALYKGPLAGEVQYYQVSLDRTRDSWLRSVTGKNTAGIHVSDLKYWDSPVVQAYHIDKLPVTYLLDREGKIVQKGLRAEELQEIIGTRE